MYAIHSHSRQTRVLLVDDNVFVRESLRNLLGEQFDIVAEARDGHEAIDCCNKLQPDVVLLDISLPDASGFDVLGQILRCCPRARTIFVSIHASEEYVHQAFRLGACGYVVKTQASQQLIPAINIAIGGASIRNTTEPRTNGFIGVQLAIHSAEVSKPELTAVDPGDVAQGTWQGPSVCGEQQRLLDQFAESVRVVMELLQDQCNAIMSGDLAANRFDLLIHAANEHKQDAKYSYLRHVQTHRCDAGHELEQR
ncbi:MAG: response regulator transcription factor [Acidobacteriaceae bacterium]|nr:response regulator transcription factor [Acidobacteriaceae bacterium]